MRQRTRRALNPSRAGAWLSWNWTSSGISFKKKLGRQSQLLEGALFEGAEVSGRVPAEAGAQDPGVVALFQAGSGFAPFDRIDRRQVLSADWGEAGQGGGGDADGGPADQAWGGGLCA